MPGASELRTSESADRWIPPAPAPDDAAPSPAEGLAWCERYARRHQENFTVVSLLLPRRLRAPMFAVYAFCRYTDDLGDEAPGDRLALLDAWKEETGRVFGGRPRHPITAALAAVAASAPLEPAPFLGLIEANRQDQIRNRYPTFGDLLRSCELSANTVGRMVLAVWGFTDARRRAFSDGTCTGLQLANHLQDVARDMKMGRIYLPLDEMRAYGVTEEQIAAGRWSPGFRDLMRFNVDRADGYFRRGLPLLDEVPRRLRVDLRLFTDGGRAVLRAIRARDFDVLRERPVVGSGVRALLLLRAAATMGLPRAFR